MDFFYNIYIILVVFYPTRSERILRCFNCHFDVKNNNCDDRFNTIGVEVKNCAGSCVKTKMYNKDEGNVYGRYCTPEREEERCQVTDSGDLRMEECYCNKDLCNAATSVVLGLPVSTVAMTFAFVIILFSLKD